MSTQTLISTVTNKIILCIWAWRDSGRRYESGFKKKNEKNGA